MITAHQDAGAGRRPVRGGGHPDAPPLAPPGPGLVAGLVVAALAGRIARWAQSRALAPGAPALAALGLSICAAAWFSAGTRPAMAAGALLLCAAVPVREAAAVLGAGLAGTAARGGWAGTAGSGVWPESAAGAAGEYGVYAGLAAGWAAAGPRRGWELATAAVILLVVRQLAGASPPPGRPADQPAGPRRGTGRRLLRLAGQSITLPAGERAALIAVTAPLWGPRMALTVLVGWGTVALGYALAERAAASRLPMAAPVPREDRRPVRSGAR